MNVDLEKKNIIMLVQLLENSNVPMSVARDAIKLLDILNATLSKAADKQ